MAVGLAGVGIYDVWQQETPSLEQPEPALPDAAGAAVSEGGSNPGVSTRTIVARNLFDVDRGVKAIEPAAPDTTPKEPEQSIDGLLLLGTVIAGSERYAIMKVPPDRTPAPAKRRGRLPNRVRSVAGDQGGTEVRRVRVGDSLRGYRVENIEEQKVVLTKGTAKTEVTIDYTREVEVAAPSKPKAKRAARKPRTRTSRGRRTPKRRDR